jgi:glycosyltransferase involved in cell wall biosynthesis
VTPLASIVIPTRDRSAFLARTLAAYTQQHERGFEVVIADDGSDDDTREVARGFAGELDVRYIRRARVGTSAARNAAIRSARGDILIFADDDRVAAPAFVADHLAAHPSGGRRIAAGRQRGLFAAWSRDAAYSAADTAALLARHPDLVPRLAEPRAELVTQAMLRSDLVGTLAAFELDEPWWQGHAQRVLDTWPGLAGFAFPWTLGVGGNLSLPRALAHEVGLHDESFIGWGLEDTEFHYRLHTAGVCTVVLDGGVNYHQVHRRGAERAHEWSRNALRMIDKHANLEVLLYLSVCLRRLDLTTANQIALDHVGVAGAAPALVAELVRVSREHLRLQLAATI